MSRKLISLFAAIAISAAVIAPASAESVTRTSVRVSYADLDLSTARGVKALKFRLSRAVDEVCGRVGKSASVTLNRHVKTCRDDAKNQAVASMNALLFAETHQTGEVYLFAGR